MFSSSRQDQLLLPVNPVFMLTTLIVAFAVNLLPLGRTPAMPDVLALVLAFWCVHQPRRFSVGLAFLCGLIMDVHDGARLGQHALSYTVLSYGAVAMHRRLLWFGVWAQALQVLPLFVLAKAVAWVARIAVGGMAPGWSYVLSPVFEAALWPLATLLLLAPQRRPPDPDETRPL
jgi:rod shape-determining protein MreD